MCKGDIKFLDMHKIISGSLERFDYKEYTTGMFLDLSKAFDTVNPYTNVSTLV